MNDVSILFPLPSTQAEYDAMLTPATPGSSGTLIDHALYVSATGFADTPPPPSFTLNIPYPSLRLVALRLDPCFAQIGPVTDAGSCQDQLRLVFQSLQFGGSSASTDDSAVHASYALSRAELLDAVQSIQALRAASRGDADLGPLAVNPILAAEGLTGPMATGLAKLVTRYAGMDRLVRLTTFDSVDARLWNFDGFNVAAGTAQPLPIPTLPDASTMLTITSEVVDGGPRDLQVQPATTSSDTIALFLDARGAQAATPASQQTAFDDTLRIENPNVESVNTIDCASCHLAPFVGGTVGKDLLGLSATGNANAFVASSTIPAGDLLTTTPSVPAPIVDLHAFSYFGSTPTINQRVVDETAWVVGYLSSP